MPLDKQSDTDRHRLKALEKENEALRRRLDRYEHMELRIGKLFETMTEGLIVMDGEERITYVNKRLEEISGFRAEELMGRKIHEFLSPETSQLIYRKISGEDEHPRRSFEIAWQRKSGETQYSIVYPHVLDRGRNGIESSFAILADITAKKQAEQEVRRREQELKNKNTRLEEMNLALQTLVRMREKDKEEIESALSANLQRLVEPLIEKLRSSGLNDRQKMVVSMLSANLAEIMTTQNKGLASRFTVLTPAEMEVANFVKNGRTTKEIAGLMNISARTVDMHRLNIRRKLGLHRKGTNLRSYLLSS